jgi:hypothetical protein
VAELGARPSPVTPADLEPVTAALARLAAAPVPATGDDVARAVAAAADRAQPDLTPITDALADLGHQDPIDLGPIVQALDDLRSQGQPDLAPIERALAELRDRPGGPTSEDLATAVAAAVAATAEQSEARNTEAVERVTKALRTIRAAVGEDLRAVVSSVDRLLERPEADLSALEAGIDDLRARPAHDPSSLDDLAAAIAGVRAELASMSARPSGATLEDLRVTADHLTAALGDVRDEVRDLRPAHAPDPAMAELTEQLDAVGRVLQDAISSLHRIEDGTVGSNPRRNRSRQSAIAAVGDLRAARQRRLDVAPLDDPAP